jgi:hypothetical protein
MANPEHLAKLREGAKAWNRWRREHRGLREPDLSRANLSEANLRAANLKEADLCRANLRAANLKEADLCRANLSEANLTGANLTGADLSRADLAVADLIGVNFSGANLHGATLYGTILDGADLSQADLQFTDLVGVDLSNANLCKAKLRETVFADAFLGGAKGLETCIHGGPSTLDHRTLERSGPLPLAFLRGCGLPDVLIDYLPSLLNQPIQFYSCFISYSTKDQEFAERLHADLQNKGVRCWFAPEDIKIGDQFRQRIDEAIRFHEKMLVILSRYSVRSDWVRDEVESSLERERREKRLVLFPVRLDKAVMDTDTAWAASMRRQRHIGDFSKWKDHDSYQKAFDRLLKDLKAGAERADTARNREN